MRRDPKGRNGVCPMREPAVGCDSAHIVPNSNEVSACVRRLDRFPPYALALRSLNQVLCALSATCLHILKRPRSSKAMIVYIVDDDERSREFLAYVLQEANIRTRGFASPSELFEHWEDAVPGCLVVDFQMPEMTGIELIREVRERGSSVPFVLVTGHATVPLVIQAFGLGAVNVIEKPFHPDELIKILESISGAVVQSKERRQVEAEVSSVKQRLQSLTKRESEVLDMVVNGRLTKQIAEELCISQKTVEVHRSNITRKIGVQSVAQLVKLVVSTQLQQSSPPAPTPNPSLLPVAKVVKTFGHYHPSHTLRSGSRQTFGRITQPPKLLASSATNTSLRSSP